MTIHTDQFGRRYDRIEDFAPASIASHIPLYDSATGRYIGALTSWIGIGWTHSLHRFGEPAFDCRELALRAFVLRADPECALRSGRDIYGTA